MEKNVNYSYNYVAKSKEADPKLFNPNLVLKLPKIKMTLPKINLCSNFELAFC